MIQLIINLKTPLIGILFFFYFPVNIRDPNTATHTGKGQKRDKEMVSWMGKLAFAPSWASPHPADAPFTYF